MFDHQNENERILHENKLGTISIGKMANLIITKPIPNYHYLHYSYGENLIDKVIIAGEEFK